MKVRARAETQPDAQPDASPDRDPRKNGAKLRNQKRGCIAFASSEEKNALMTTIAECETRQYYY